MSDNTKQSEFSKRPIGVIVENIIMFVILFVITFFVITGSPGKSWYGRDTEKDCFSNIRVITGLVEMYNMDNKEPMDEINDENIKILKEKKYLKYNIKLPDNKCRYYAKGKLSENGVICCDYHGSIDSPGFYSMERKRDVRSKTIKLLLICTICALIPTTFNFILSYFFSDVIALIIILSLSGIIFLIFQFL